MNTKAIRSVLVKKVADWLGTITDERVRNLAKKNTIITGGAIVSLLTGDKVKDYDVYFRDKETTREVAKYYVAKFNEAHPGTEATVKETDERIEVYIKSRGVAGEVSDDAQAFEDVYDVLEKTVDTGKEKYRPIFLSSNAITLSNKIQIVVRFYGEPDKIHENYDFVHCTNYWTSWNGLLTLRQEALEAILTKELRYIGSKYPVCSVIRTRKFIKRGWNINAGQYLKMLYQISKLNLDDIEILRDQLTGVDSAYFGILIDALKRKMEVDPDFKLSTGYLAEIIDRIF